MLLFVVQVTLTRNSRSGSLTVDGVVLETSSSPGDNNQLNTENSLIYVGGVPNDLQKYGLFDNPDEVIND